VRILVTGGAGYIGSHTCIELIEAGYDLVVLDNLCNSSIESIKRVETLTGTTIPFYKTDILDKDGLREVFKENIIEGVIHFAGLKAVGESVEMPLKYYANNFGGTCNLIDVMTEFGCYIFVFSSSATVYGDPSVVPIREDSKLNAINPYGRSKLMIEQFLQDIFSSSPFWRLGVLRYFNPIGAHSSGLIGEAPNSIPNNLIPFISQVAVGKLKKLNVFGGNYDTPDGTGIRDYIHVTDLAKGHVEALKALEKKSQIITVNLGTGIGYSVMEIIKTFEEVSGKKIPYEVVDRRPGDIAKCYADPSYALELLGWKAELDLHQMCEDSWRWQSKNPNGY